MDYKEYYKLQAEEAGEWSGQWADQMVKALNEVVKNLPNTSWILDIGCNTGRSLYELQKLGFNNILGVDLIEEKCIQARKLGLPAISMSADNLFLFKDKAFDFGFMSHTIEHILNPAKAISEITRVCKAGLIICPIEEKVEGENKGPHVSPFYGELEWANIFNRNTNIVGSHTPKHRLGKEVWTAFGMDK